MSKTEQVTISKAEYAKLKQQAQGKRKKGSKAFKKEIKRKEEANKIKRAKLDQENREKANEYALRLRKESTLSEKMFKVKLKLAGFKYSFQHPVYPRNSFYILDFFLPTERIAIEIDGDYHLDFKQRAKDKYRDKVVLEDLGIKTIRISNDSVEKFDEHYFKTLIDKHIKDKNK